MITGGDCWPALSHLTLPKLQLATSMFKTTNTFFLIQSSLLTLDAISDRSHSLS